MIAFPVSPIRSGALGYRRAKRGVTPGAGVVDIMPQLYQAPAALSITD